MISIPSAHPYGVKGDLFVVELDPEEIIPGNSMRELDPLAGVVFCHAGLGKYFLQVGPTVFIAPIFEEIVESPDIELASGKGLFESGRHDFCQADLFMIVREIDIGDGLIPPHDVIDH